MNDKTQSLNISASSGAEIAGTIDGVPFKGPGVVQVTRENKNKVIAVTTPGCTPETSLQKKVDTNFWINILTGGTFGSTTDYATEKMWTYGDSVVITCKQ